MISRRALLRAGVGAAGLVAIGSWSTAQAQPATRWDRLRGALTGDLVLPTDNTYDTARQLDNGYFDTIRPQAIAYCANTNDIRTCLHFAQDNDIHTAVRSGGHSAAGYSTTTGLVLDVSRLNAINVGPTTVTLGPGAQGVDVLATLAARGLSAITGNCPTVCAGGYLQGGGIGPLARKFGVASDRLVSADVVLADGRLVRCSTDVRPELFWALRGGGGGNFGVVTRFEITPTTIQRMTTFSLVWPWAQAADVIAAHLPWLAAAPDDLTADLHVINAGAQPVVVVSGGWLADPAALDPHLNDLIAAIGTQPLSRFVTDQTYQQAMMTQFNCANDTLAQCHRAGTNPSALLPRHSFVVDRGRLLSQPLTTTAINEALTAFEANPTNGQFRLMGFGGLGGQINRIAQTATAYPHRSAQSYFSYTVGLNSFTPTPDDQAAAQSWAANGFAVTQRYGDGQGQVNFIDPQLGDWRTAYYGSNYNRLARIKNHYDPDGFFRFPQSVGS
jgi:FAD/FMN-containing dehydrogenase